MDTAHPQNFFISYNKQDRQWAEWIAWELESAGYTTVIQAWDFKPGQNFVGQMDEAIKNSDRTLAVLSPDYLTSAYTAPEWYAAFNRDPRGVKGVLLPIKVRACDPEGLLAQITHIDLAGLNEKTAKSSLLAGVSQTSRLKPSTAPLFPGNKTPVKTNKPRFPGTLPPIWSVNHHRNDNLFARDDFIDKIHNTFFIDCKTRQAITGMQGIGKTQVAIEYAYRYSNQYDLIWWIDAAEPTYLADSFAALAPHLGLNIENEQDINVIARMVRDELGKRSATGLLIFDNVIKPVDIEKYLPQSSNGHILITSTNQKIWSGIAVEQEIPLFSREEAADYLLEITSGKSEKDLALDLADKLGGLPLALEQSAAYIRSNQITLRDYQNLFNQYHGQLFGEEGAQDRYHASVTTTFNITIDTIKAKEAESVNLLYLTAFLAPTAIPEALFTEGHEYLPANLAEAVNDPLRFNRIKRMLLDYSLINVQNQALNVHRLVQLVSRERLSPKETAEWIEIVLNLVKNAFCFDRMSPDTWGAADEIYPHTMEITEYAEKLEINPHKSSYLLNKIGLYLRNKAEYELAGEVFQRALNILELYEVKDGNMAAVLDNLGGLYRDQGKNQAAESLYKQALEIRENVLGSNHPAVGITLNNLAGLYRAQGKYEIAEPLYKRDLEISEKELGPNHLDVAPTLNNLAGLYEYQGKYEDAEPLYERALKISGKELGPNHPDVATTLNNLAGLYYAQGKYEDAEPLYERALEIREKVLGPNHPSVATTLNNLAVLYEDQGEYETAVLLFKRAIDICEKALGTDHPKVIIIKDNLNALYKVMGKLR